MNKIKRYLLYTLYTIFFVVVGTIGAFIILPILILSAYLEGFSFRRNKT